MNIRLVAKHLGTVCLLIGFSMLFCLPWALPQLGHRAGVETVERFEADGFQALVLSIVLSALVAASLHAFGRKAQGKLYRKEAMAIVGLSWILATLLGSLPFSLSDTYRSASVRITRVDEAVQLYDFNGHAWSQWIAKPQVAEETYQLLQALLEAGARGLGERQLRETHPDADQFLRQLTEDNDWQSVLSFPGEPGSEDRLDNYRIRWVPMSFIDALFEAQSGFSTTGATVISDLEDPKLISHCILFWRSLTHFLGGLGIIVLFVVILGQGSAGKAMMRAEMPGPSKDGSQSRMQHTAWIFAAIYCALNLVLTVILIALGLTVFDALCHAFGTMATGGFSTYNSSVGHFDRPLIEYIVICFMVLAGTNFTLLYLVLRGDPGRLFQDVEWRTYVGVILLVTAVVIVFGLLHDDFHSPTESGIWVELKNSLRFGLFQVVSILTTTGYGTHNFDDWNSFGRGVLFLLMFVGGCAGSTGGGLKVIRHVLFLKILRLEIEQSFHPSVVRPLKLGGRAVDDGDLRKNILVYFCLMLFIFVFSWLFIITVEPDITWGNDPQHKLLDSASAVAAMLNNIGPGLGTVGATENYGHFSGVAKIHFTWLMMLGRVEVFAILVLVLPSFWRSRG